MPGRDGTGPMGRGTMSGRGLGVCNGANTGGYGFGFGRGSGRGLGLGAGFGCRRGFGGVFTGEAVALSDKEILSNQKELLQKRLELVRKQLENMSEVNK